jgi:iron complex outermembrane receptor protein
LREAKFQKENNHTGGNDGNNVQLVYYGTSLGKDKSFMYNSTGFPGRDQTSRAGLEGDTRQEFTGYNTIERLSTLME